MYICKSQVKVTLTSFPI